MADIPIREPTRCVAGDTITWKKSLPEYPASAGWVLSYRLINAAGRIDISSVADGGDHLVIVVASTSSTYAPGDYSWSAAVTRGVERYTIATGSLTIRPDLSAQSTGYDTRTVARKALDAVDAALLAFGDKAFQQEYEIGDRRMRFRSHGEFLQLRDRLRNEVRAEESAERIANGLGSPSRVLVRF